MLFQTAWVNWTICSIWTHFLWKEGGDICMWWPLTGRFVSASLYLHPNQFEQDQKGWHQQGTLPLFKWISSIWYILRLIEEVSLCGIHQHYRRHSMTFCLHVYLLEQNRTPPKGEPTLLPPNCVSLRGQNRHEDQTLLCDWHLEHVPCWSMDLIGWWWSEVNVYILVLFEDYTVSFMHTSSSVAYINVNVYHIPTPH